MDAFPRGIMLEGVPNVLTGRSTRARREGVVCAMSKGLVSWSISQSESARRSLQSLGVEAYCEQSERAGEGQTRLRAKCICCQQPI